MKKRDFIVGVITWIFGITCLFFSQVLSIELKSTLLGGLLSGLGGGCIGSGTVILCKYNTRLKNENKDNEKKKMKTLSHMIDIRGNFFGEKIKYFIWYDCKFIINFFKYHTHRAYSIT